VTRLLSMVAGLCATALLAACARPTYSFVTNADDHVYFKVPAGYQKIDKGELDKVAVLGMDASSAAALRAQTWSVAFEAKDKPLVTDVFSSQTARSPIVFARVIRAGNGETPTVTLDTLRNLFLPVSDSARAAALAAGQQLAGFHSVTDEVLTRKGGMTGVHEVFRYTSGGVPQTFDSTAFMTKNASRVYALLVRCTQTCYADRHGELVSIVRSFTVKSGP
jgi:hypothetical protein